MKRLLLIMLVMVSLCSRAAAQDTIRRINGNIILAKVDTVGSYDIRYSRYADDRDFRQIISKSVVAGISYADGRKDTFFVLKNREVTNTSPMLSMPESELYQLGRRDAKKYYLRTNGASTGTLLATFPGSPLLGLIVGGVCTATPPQEKNLGIPNAALARNSAYHDGYYKKARGIKAGRVWTAFGIGVAANIAFLLILGK
jgi:hypothetical protein